MVHRTFVIPYLILEDEALITIQRKAWIDTARVCMWVDLLLGPAGVR